MRVLVASEAVGGLGCVASATALASGWAQAGAQVAAVPLASGGPGLGEALAALLGGEVVHEGPSWLVRAAGTLAVGAEGGLGGLVRKTPPEAERVVIDLTGTAAGPQRDGDALAGELRAWLDGRELVAVVDPADLELRLLGLRGAVAEAAFAAGVDAAERLAREGAAKAWLERLGVADEPERAGGGAGAVVLAAGGRLVDGFGLCAEVSGLTSTISRAEAVVTGCTGFHIGNHGGSLVQRLAELAGEHLVPFLVFARELEVSRREMRTFGVEAAYAIGPGPVEAALQAAALRVARGWVGAGTGA